MTELQNNYTKLIVNFFEHVPDFESKNLFCGKAISNKKLKKGWKKFSKLGIKKDKIYLSFNSDFVITESDLYWYLPMSPGGAFKKGCIPLADIKNISLTKYVSPVMGKMKFLQKMGESLTSGYLRTIMCNGKNIGVISAESENDLKILEYLFGKFDSGNQEFGKEDVEKINAIFVDILNAHQKASGEKINIHKAVKKGEVDTVKAYIESGADVNASSTFSSKTPLYLAVDSNHNEIVTLLLAGGADVNSRSGSKNQTIIFGCKDVEIAKLLIGGGADLDTKDDDGRTPLFDCDDPEMAKILIDGGVDPNVKDNEGNTVLHNASFLDKMELVEVLLDNGADINIKGALDKTPLYSVVSWSRVNMTKLFLSRGADISVKDHRGQTPFQEVAKKVDPHINIVELLLDNGAEIDQRDDLQRTTLHWAANWGNIKLIELLLSRGADINLRDGLNRTPLDLALEEKHEELVGLLEQNQSDLKVDPEDTKGWIMAKLGSLPKNTLMDERRMKNALLKIRSVSPPPFRFIPKFVLFKIGLKCRDIVLGKLQGLNEISSFRPEAKDEELLDTYIDSDFEVQPNEKGFVGMAEQYISQDTFDENHETMYNLGEASGITEERMLILLDWVFEKIETEIDLNE
jgi:ankyrin repeat protein